MLVLGVERVNLYKEVKRFLVIKLGGVISVVFEGIYLVSVFLLINVRIFEEGKCVSYVWRDGLVY